MAIIALPSSLAPNSGKIIPVHAATRLTSPYTQTTQVIGWGGQNLGIELRYTTLNEARRRAMIAFLGRLGPTDQFTVHDYFHAQGGVLGGTPRVQGSNQTGSSLFTDGWTASANGIVRAGDHVSIGSRLFIVTSDANSNAGGQATLNIFPAIRVAPADNALIDVSNPVGLWELTSHPDVIDIPKFAATMLSAVQKMN